MNVTMQEIIRLKKELGTRVVIPVHHYQNQAVTSIADILGDSYKLAVDCSKTDAEFIVFCGVLFMAESSDILKKPHQKVVIPVATADCPMANMVDLDGVNRIWSELAAKTSAPIAPIVYMNSYADLKAFCGDHGGSVCTSSNAKKIMKYYIDKGMKILFSPDANLGINTAYELGLSDDDIIRTTKLSMYKDETVIVWDGFCPVHKRFSTTDVAVLRKEYEGAQIIVHPECPKEIVDLADYVGSTEYILQTIAGSPAGSIWGVGTETVFVERLQAEYPDKTIVALKTSECMNMQKTTVEHVLKSLRNIKEHIESNGETPLNNQIIVADTYRHAANAALNTMISIVNGG